MIDRRALITVLPVLALPGVARAQPAWPAKLVAAARAQIGRTVLYDPAYVRLAYPGGDAPADGVGRLQHGARHAGLGEAAGAGEPGEAGADDGDVGRHRAAVVVR